MAFFYFFIFCCFFLGTFNIGPYSIRVYVTLMMAVLLFFTKKKNKVHTFPNKFLRFFILYIVVTSVTLLASGEISGDDFNYGKTILAYYFPAIVIYIAIGKYLDTFEKLQKFCYFLLCLLLINCIITILQYLGNPFGKAIAILFVTSSEVQYDMANDFGSTSLFGEGRAIGLMGTTFTNANFIATLGILAVGLYFKEKKILLKLFLGSLVIFVIWSCLTTQGRTPFGMLILFTLILFLKSPIQSNEKFFLILVIFLIGISFIPSLIDSDILGRIGKKDAYEGDVRIQVVWSDCIDFIMDHPIYGGPVSYSRVFKIAPHNYFLNALITSGLIGGGIAIYLYVSTVIYAIRAFLKKHSIVVYAFIAAFMIYMSNSLFHNASILTGDSLFFLIYPLMMTSINLESINHEK